MSYSEYYFGKPVEELTFEADLEPFIRKEEPESQTLEYKSDGTRLSDHGETISAFLNSGGGLLIIGGPEEVEIPLPGGRKSRVCRGAFNPRTAISKDDAHRSLLSKVLPVPAGVRLKPIPCGEGRVIVVDVESSTYPPHQYDAAYFIRLDGETKKAPHALVESLFLQRRGPNLECQLDVVRLRPLRSEDHLDRFELGMRAVVRNQSRHIAEYVAFDLKSDPVLAQAGCTLRPEDQQPGDQVLPGVTDAEGCRLERYRLKSDVMHAYSWKSLEIHYTVTRTHEQGRHARFTIDLQAKDMLRRRYEYHVVLDYPHRPNETIQPERVESLVVLDYPHRPNETIQPERVESLGFIR